MRFTAAAQLRPLAKVESKTEMQDVLRRAAKKIEPDRHGDKVPTMAGLEEAVRDSTATVDYTPEQLRKDAQQRRWDEAERQRQAHQRQGIPVDDAELPGQTHLFQELSAEVPSRTSTAETPSGALEPGPGMFGRGLQVHDDDTPLTTMHLAALGAEPQDGSDPDYWNGQPNAYARQLRGLGRWLRKAIGLDFPGDRSHGDVANLLRSIAMEVEFGKLSAPKVARRAK